VRPVVVASSSGATAAVPCQSATRITSAGGHGQCRIMGSPPGLTCSMHQDDDPRTRLAASLEAYRARWPAEAACIDLFTRLAADVGDPYVRDRLEGHFTASSWLVSRDGARTLLTHHRKLGLWLQPGGHADGDRDLARVALREAGEETGLPGLEVEPGIFDLD